MRQVNWTYVVVKTVVLMFMVGAAVISFGHIVDVSHTLGLTWEAYTVPFFIDGLAILGLVGRSSSFARSTQRAGWVLVGFAGTLSLVANVLAGDNLGQQLYGALVVIGFGLAEWYATKLKVAPPVVDEALRAKRSAASRKAAATRKANLAKAARANRRTTRTTAPAVRPVPVTAE